MQTASPSKPLLLVTIGPPGAGKSFFARRFAEMFNAPLVSFDEIRYELFNDITFSDDENTIVARIAGLQLRELLRTNKTIIIDGGHNPKVSRIELGKLARSKNYNVLYIWVQSDEKTARDRSLRRSTKREDDTFNRSLTQDEFTSMARKFTPPSQYESFVVISGRHTYGTQAKTVLKNMVTPRDTTKKDISVTTPPKQTPGRGRTISF